ncbi:MAG: TetR family transcriptional regulator [Thermoleophilia bacterium]|nr:TetR family transcriptional regulator [Thermoleophilia bacterium]
MTRPIPGERTGRRPGPSTTRAEILAAARANFAELGYDGTSVRGIAARAGVDPALVHRFYGRKDDILVAAVSVAMSPSDRIPELMEGKPSGLGERVVRYFLSVWEEPQRREVLIAMLRSAATNERAAELLREFVRREVVDRVTASLRHEHAELRATLVGSQLVGLAMARYVVRVEPLASATPETVVAAVAPTLQRYLTGRLALPGSG